MRGHKRPFDTRGSLLTQAVRWVGDLDLFMRGIILLSAVFLALAAILALWNPLGAERRPADPTTPEATVHAWVAAHRNGDVARAYALLSPAAQQSHAFDTYQQGDFSRLGTAGAEPLVIIAPLGTGAADSWVRVAVGLSARDGIVNRFGDGPGDRSLTVHLVQSSEGWRIASVDPWPPSYRRPPR